MYTRICTKREIFIIFPRHWLTGYFFLVFTGRNANYLKNKHPLHMQSKVQEISVNFHSSYAWAWHLWVKEVR